MSENFTLRFPCAMQYIVCMVIVCLFCGCAKWRGYMRIDTSLPAEADIAIDALLADASLGHSDPILVATVVNVDSIEESSTFGRMFSELLAASLVRRQFAVKEIKTGSSIFIRKQGGEFLLSRDLSRLKKQYDASTLVVGTYAVAKYTVILSVRLVDAESSLVLSSYETVLPLGSDLRGLVFQ